MNAANFAGWQGDSNSRGNDAATRLPSRSLPAVGLGPEVQSPAALQAAGRLRSAREKDKPADGAAGFITPPRSVEGSNRRRVLAHGVPLMHLRTEFLTEKLKSSLIALAVGAGFTFGGLYFTAIRPLAGSIDQMRRELVQVERRMGDLADSRGRVSEATSLLSELRKQNGELSAARESLASLQALRSELIAESSRHETAAAALAESQALHSRLIEAQNATRQAESSFAEMRRLQERIQSQLESNRAAAKTLEEIVDLKEQIGDQAGDLQLAKTALEDLVRIGERLRDQHGKLNEAKTSLDGLTELKDGLASAATDLEAAQTVSTQWTQLGKRLAESSEGAEVALNRAELLLALNTTLTRDDLRTADAQTALAGLIRIHEQLKQTPKSLADSLQTLELFGRFQEEFAAQTQVLTAMRRSLVDVSLMEATFTKVVRMLEPLAELGDLRRLNEEDIRQAARSILDARTAERVPNPAATKRPEADVAPTADAAAIGNGQATSTAKAATPGSATSNGTAER